MWFKCIYECAPISTSPTKYKRKYWRSHLFFSLYCPFSSKDLTFWCSNFFNPSFKKTVSKVGLCDSDCLFIRLKFLPGKWLFQVWKQKDVARGQVWRIRWMGQHFVDQFIQFVPGLGRGMSWCVVMVEKHFPLHWRCFFFLQFGVESVQQLGIVQARDAFALLQVVNVD